MSKLKKKTDTPEPTNNPWLRAILEVIKPDEVARQIAKLKATLRDEKLGDEERRTVERTVGHFEGLAQILAKK